MLKDKEKPSQKFFIWFLGILFIASFIINVFLLRKGNEGNIAFEKLNQKNTEIAQKLKTAKDELSRFRGVSAKMDAVVKEATTKLDEKERKIRTILSDKKILEAENQKLIQEIDSIKNKYVDVIDSLLVAKQLNKSLNSTISLMSGKIEELSTKLGYASRLSSEAIKVTPLKKSFANKEMQTALAKRTQKIKICFDIIDNKVTDPGLKDLYVRILTPDAVVLSDHEPPLMFMHPELKQKVVYTIDESINYKNQKETVCVKWQGTEAYKPGLYIVEIFTKENKLGMTTFTLK